MTTMIRIPCSKCGQLNDVERAAEREFRCTACGTVNRLQSLSAVPTATQPPAPRQRAAWAPTVVTRRTGTAPAPRERSGRLNRARQVLVALMVVGIGATLLHGNGTFATFNATTTNAANITTGTLLLGDTVA